MRLRAAAVACALMLAVAACGGDDGGGDGEEATDSTTPSTTSAPTTTLDEETRKEEAARAAYLAFYEAYRAATADPVDPLDPTLQALITGDHKLAVTRNLEDRQAKGQAVRLPPGSRSRHDIRSAELQPDGSVEIIDCEIDDAIVYEVDGNAVVDDEVVTNLVTGTVTHESGEWKVAYTEVLDSWPGVTECDG